MVIRGKYQSQYVFKNIRFLRIAFTSKSLKVVEKPKNLSHAWIHLFILLLCHPWHEYGWVTNLLILIISCLEVLTFMS